MTAVSIRSAFSRDIPAIADILRRATRDAFTFMAWTHSDESFAGFVDESFAGWDHVRLAEADGKPLGFGCLAGDHIDQLFVASEYQRQGVGSALLADLQGLRPGGFRLATFRKNAAARASYEHHGLSAVDFGVSAAENEPDVTYCWQPR